MRTLRSRYFRENLAHAELTQILLACERLQENPLGAESSLRLLGRCFLELSDDVFDKRQQPSEFELAAEPEPIEEFSLFLQEFFGSNTPLPKLLRERTET